MPKGTANIQSIATILHWAPTDVREAMRELQGGFMAPQIVHRVAGGHRSLGESPEDFPETGWYARLSANGYLDCTDWQGPFESPEAAVAALLSEFCD